MKNLLDKIKKQGDETIDLLNEITVLYQYVCSRSDGISKGELKQSARLARNICSHSHNLKSELSEVAEITHDKWQAEKAKEHNDWVELACTTIECSLSDKWSLDNISRMRNSSYRSEFKKIKCPLCTTFKLHGTIVSPSNCSKCPLFQYKGFTCKDDRHPYAKWLDRPLETHALDIRILLLKLFGWTIKKQGIGRFK